MLLKQNLSITCNTIQYNTLLTDYQIDLQIGRTVASGGFCDIKITGTTYPPRYVIKQLSPDTINSKKDFRDGLTDLVLEGRLLAGIHNHNQHENIIKLQGFAKPEWNSSDRDSYFVKQFGIVIEYLPMTLDVKYVGWRQDEMRAMFLPPCSTKKRDNAKRIIRERLTTCIGISNALEFLHSKK